MINWIVKKLWILCVLALIIFLIQVAIGNKEFDPGFIFSMIFGGIISLAFNIIPKLGNKNSVPINKKTIEDLMMEVKNSEILANPSTINITRESSFVAAVVNFEIFLNDRSMGLLKNGTTISAKTNFRKNIISCPMSSCIIAFEIKEDIVNFNFKNRGNKSIEIISGGII